MLEFKDLDYKERTSKGLVLVDIKTEWCGPCKAMAPVLEELAIEYTGKVTFGKIDADENPETSKDLQIRSVPTLLLYKDGVVIEKSVGLSNKEKIKSMFEKHI